MKNIFALLTLFLFTVTSTSAWDNPNHNNSYKKMVIDSSLNFSAERDGYIVTSKWNEYTGTDFQYYKVMRSETVSNPVYPDNPAIQYLDRSEKTMHTNKDWNTKWAYYRVCVITTEKWRKCSNVVKVNWFDGKKDEKPYTKPYEKSTPKPVVIELSHKMKEKADAIVEKFITRIENKFETNKERYSVLSKVNMKLKKMSYNNYRLKPLVNYMVMKLEEKMQDYSDDFSEIENILNEF